MEKIEDKKHLLRFAAVNRETWKQIKKGIKKVETRAGSVKYLRVKVGDTLVMCCEGEKFEKKVTKITHVKSIRALLKKYTPQDINPTITTLEETEKMYYSYSGYKEKIAEFGILAFELA